jgi:hypothetical protein
LAESFLIQKVISDREEKYNNNGKKGEEFLTHFKSRTLPPWLPQKKKGGIKGAKVSN